MSRLSAYSCCLCGRTLTSDELDERTCESCQEDQSDEEEEIEEAKPEVSATLESEFFRRLVLSMKDERRV